jgi:hypothetical protein
MLKGDQAFTRRLACKLNCYSNGRLTRNVFVALRRVVVTSASLMSASAFGPGAIHFVKPCDNHLQESLKLAERMIMLSFQGDEDREDNGCGIIYGVMRDAGYRLRDMIRREIEHHNRKTQKP